MISIEGLMPVKGYTLVKAIQKPDTDTDGFIDPNVSGDEPYCEVVHGDAGKGRRVTIYGNPYWQEYLEGKYAIISNDDINGIFLH